MTITEIPWSTQADLPILAILQLIPLAAMITVLLFRSGRAVFQIGLGAAILELIVAIELYRHFDPAQPGLHFAEHLRLFGPLAYHAAVDGMSIIFILLAALLTILMVLYAPVRGLADLPRVMAVIFGVEATVMSLFTTVDLLWFVLLSTVQLILVGYMVWRWATSPEKNMAFTRFLQFMGTGLLLLFIGTIMLGWNHHDVAGGRWTFDLLELAQVKVKPEFASVVFFLLFYGFAVRTPLFPFHGWLPLVAEHGSVSLGPVFLLGLKTGIYAILRFIFPLLHDAVMEWHVYVIAFAVAGIFYAALLAMMQNNLRRLLAFAVVSHTSILVIGLFSLNHLAFQGSVLLSVNFGLAITALLFMAGLVYRRTNTLLLSRLGGLFDRIPLLGIVFFVAGLSIVGMPGTPGFDSAHLVMEAAMERFGALTTIAAALGNVVAAGFLLWAFQRAFLSQQPEGVRYSAIEKASGLEKLVAVVMLLTLLVAGFESEPMMVLVDKSFVGLEALYSSTSGGH